MKKTGNTSSNTDLSLLRKKLNSLPPDVLKSLARDSYRLNTEDPRGLITSSFYIQDRHGKIELLDPLKRPQEKILAARKWFKKEGLPVRIRVLKARREGVSTIISALGLIGSWEGKNSLVIAHNKDTSEWIFGMYERFHRLYKGKKPNAPRPNSKKLVYTDCEGRVTVETANNLQAGTGKEIHILHASEPPKWEKGAQTAISLWQAVADNPETEIYEEGTGYGYDSLFHPAWVSTIDKVDVHWIEEEDGSMTMDAEIHDRVNWDGYIPIFSGWQEDPDNVRKFGSLEEQEQFMKSLDDYDDWLLGELDLEPEQVYWYETTCLTSRCKGDKRTRKQEYPTIWQEAFQSMGGNRFTADRLEQMDCRPGTPITLKVDLSWQKNFTPVRDTNSDFRVNEYPRARHRYIISFDPAGGRILEGSNEPDRSVFHVYDMDHYGGMMQVARYSGWAEEEEVFQIAHLVAIWYNEAFIVPLVTGGRGVHFCTEFEKVYPPMKIFHEGRNFGLTEHRGNKASMVSNLSLAIDSGGIIFSFRETVDQHLKYKRYNSGKLSAPDGEFDDEVSAAYAAVQGAPEYPFDMEQIKRSRTDRRVDMDEFGGYSETI